MEVTIVWGGVWGAGCSADPQTYASSLRLLMPEYECMIYGDTYLEHTYPRGQLEADLLLEPTQQYRPHPA